MYRFFFMIFLFSPFLSLSKLTRYTLKKAKERGLSKKQLVEGLETIRNTKYAPRKLEDSIYSLFKGPNLDRMTKNFAFGPIIQYQMREAEATMKANSSEHYSEDPLMQDSYKLYSRIKKDIDDTKEDFEKRIKVFTDALNSNK